MSDPPFSRNERTIIRPNPGGRRPSSPATPPPSAQPPQYPPPGAVPPASGASAPGISPFYQTYRPVTSANLDEGARSPGKL